MSLLDMDSRLARSKLSEAFNKFNNEVWEIIVDKINDSISVDEINNGTKEVVERTVLHWIRSIMFEKIHDDLGGEEAVAREFDNIYFQICGMKLGPEDFRHKAKPYKDI